MNVFTAISSAISGKDAENATEETKASLNLLKEFAEAKAKFLEKTISESIRTAGTAENATVPIESIIATENFIGVKAKAVTSNLDETVTSIVETICGGDASTSQNVAKMAAKVIGQLLGSESGEDVEKRKYVVYVEGLSLIRLDMHVWSRNIHATGLLKGDDQSLVVISFFKSSVDVNKVKLNTFLSLYKNQLNGLRNEKDYSKQNLIDDLKHAKEVHTFFHD